MKDPIQDLNDSMNGARAVNAFCDKLFGTVGVTTPTPPEQEVIRSQDAKATRVSGPMTLEVDDDCIFIDIATALAEKHMVIKWTGVPGKARIMLTEQGLVLKQSRLERGRKFYMDSSPEKDIPASFRNPEPKP